MPSGIKAVISLVVLMIGAFAHWYEGQAGNDLLSWIVVGLAFFMVLAMWIFPETGSRKGNR